ncbi:DEAD/DEAH box helicase family protein [Candidatus Minimicrobia vallesae]|uniref:DEAD/DEAH box helicase family protein n=1 Tax=Candidatus Minimicrobia vallesae TaxID=2841264 RepID=A0A8F1MAL2_9BACT|nr:DEAD/DEAH box helicase family protein [Candidatus Minimicrobia vallesae]
MSDFTNFYAYFANHLVKYRPAYFIDSLFYLLFRHSSLLTLLRLRFGKTLSSYDFAKKFNAKNVLIITNRPAIANSWFDDFEKFIDGYYFISTADSLKKRETLSRDEFLNKANSSSEDKQITFLSLQDLKGGRAFGGPHNKLKWVADLKWDLLIIDEAGKMIELDAEQVSTYHHEGGC